MTSLLLQRFRNFFVFVDFITFLWSSHLQRCGGNLTIVKLKGQSGDLLHHHHQWPEEKKKQKKLWNKIMCWYVERGIECFSHTECYVTCQNLTSDNCMLGWAWPLPVWEWGNHRVNMENKRRCINTGKLPVDFYPQECSSDSTAGK